LLDNSEIFLKEPRPGPHGGGRRFFIACSLRYFLNYQPATHAAYRKGSLKAAATLPPRFRVRGQKKNS